MKNGKQCTISLLSSSKQQGTILYQLEVQHQGGRCILSLRYSTIRRIAKLLPNSDIKFPEPQHLTSILSQLTGNVDFFKKRYLQLTLYFQAVSKIAELKDSLGFSMLISQRGQPTIEDSESFDNPPPAPKIVGRKLSARQTQMIC